MKKKILVGVLIVVGLVLGAGATSQAYINPDITQVNEEVGIAVSPLKSERFQMEPGGEYSGQFRVRHTGHDTSDMVVKIAPLTEARDYEVETARTQIKKWTTFGLEGAECVIDRVEDGDAYFTMRPQEECFISYSIKVPDNAVGGSQDAAILIKTATREDVGSDIGSAGVKYEYQFAYSLFSDVSGPSASYAGRVIENNVPWLIFNPPLGVSSEVENTGTLDFSTYYEVKMSNWFGGQEVYNAKWDGVTFAGSTHDDSAEWEGAPALGLFRVTQRITVLNKVSEVTRLVLIFPIWLLMIFIGVVLLLVWALYLKIRGRRGKIGFKKKY